MGDNVAYQAAALATPASGTTVATDEVQVGGTQPLAQVQWVKLADGTPNGTGYVPATVANGLLVDVSRVQGTVDVGDRAARLLGVVDKGKVWDGTNIAAVKAGVVAVAGDNPLVVTVHPSSAPTATQPVSAASLPLPAGAATAANQATIKAASTLAAATDTSQVVQQSPMRADASTLWVTATAAVNTGVTLTLPAAAAGLFHYITSIEVVKLYSVVGVAAGAGVLITTTNLPGNPVWTTEQLASAAGTATTVVKVTPTTPLKSAVAATATTIVCPVQLQTIWRVNVSYYTAP